MLQLEMDQFADDGSLDDNVESFLSHEEADQREPLFSCSKKSPIGQSKDIGKGVIFLSYRVPFIHVLWILFFCLM